MSCGATALILLIIDSKAYVFNLGDNKGIIRRSDHLYQLSIDHIPVCFILKFHRVELMKRIGYSSKVVTSSTID